MEAPLYEPTVRLDCQATVYFLNWMIFIYKDFIWIYAHICDQLLAEIFSIDPEPKLIFILIYFDIKHWANETEFI